MTTPRPANSPAEQPRPPGSANDLAASAVARRPLAVSAAYAITGTGFYHLCQLSVVVLLNKLAGPDIAGQYFLGLAIAMPVILFFGLELRGAIVADVGREFTVGTYHALRTTALVPATLILAGYLAWAWMTGTRGPYLEILTGVFAGRLAWALAEAGWGTFQRRERLDLVAIAYTLRGLALLAPFAVLLPLMHGHDDPANASSPAARAAGWAALLHAFGYLAIYYAFDRPRVLDRRLWDPSWNWTTVRALALQTLPLGFVSLAINLCDSLPRWLFERVPDGTRQLGYFGSLAYITQAGNLIVIQCAVAAANRLSLYYQRNLRAFLRLLSLLLGGAAALGAALVFVAIFAGRWLLTLLYTSDYLPYEHEFTVIVLAQALALLTNVLGAVTTQMRLFWVQVPVQLATLLATGIAAAVLIPGPTPVRGGAYTILVRSIVQFALYAGCVGLGIAQRRSRLSQA